MKSLLCILVCLPLVACSAKEESHIEVKRFAENPILHEGLSDTLGNKLNGPSLIRVPDWVKDPFGKYYLYFAHHKGNFIRLAYADDLHGPWRIYEPGTIHL